MQVYIGKKWFYNKNAFDFINRRYNTVKRFVVGKIYLMFLKEISYANTVFVHNIYANGHTLLTLNLGLTDWFAHKNGHGSNSE